MAELTAILQSDWVAHAGIHVHANATAQSIANGATYIKVVNFSDNDPALNCTPDAANDQITIGANGIYSIDGAFSFSAANNITFFGSLFVDGGEVESLHWTRKIGTAGDIGNSTFTGLLSLTAGQVIDFRVRHNDVSPVNATFSYMNLNCTKIDKA